MKFKSVQNNKLKNKKDCCGAGGQQTMAESRQFTVFITKFLWDKAEPISSHSIYGCFCTTEELSSSERNPSARKAENIYRVAFYKKSLLTHCGE